MSTPIKKVLLLSVLILLLITGYIVVRLGMASVNQYFLQVYIDSWDQTGKMPADHQWQKANSFFDKASYWHASSPSLLLLGGDLFLWKAASETSGLARNKALQQALTLYTRSIRQRPAYVYGWLSYAIVKDKLGQRDALFHTAMRKLDELGRYEPAVLLGGVQIYFGYLSELNAEERKSLKKQIGRLVKIDPDSLIDVVKRYNLTIYLCYRVKGIQEVDDFCKR
ncbi:MAG TPA: hypothetical protein ENI62_01800 [Gammaproteobacteria bacterium]|nr:hypothetical protein [Gammaproteobacteria bacterium]